MKRTIDEKARTVEIEGMGARVASRTRLVFNMPIPNLWKQVLDTAIHNVFMQYPTFHHDMFGKRILPVTGTHMAFDVKHFERHTAAIVRARASMFGGMYAKIASVFASLPFAVPDESWKEFAFLYPARSRGFSDQFASGDSAVAPAQKEVFTALYAEFMKEAFNLSPLEALSSVFTGGRERLTIRNYGDDNSVNGDPVVLKDLLAFLKQYLTVEEEIPPKFLGFVWYDGMGWKLPVDSYLKGTYLNERRPFSNFRKFPFMGWVLKRKVFLDLGHPRIGSEVFPAEDTLLAKNGLPWHVVMARAEDERLHSLSQSGLRDTNFVLGKDYLMSAEAKIQTGEYFGLMPVDTAPIVKALLSEEWNNKLRW